MTNIPRKTLHIEFYIRKVWQDKDNFAPKNILMYSLERDRVLSTSRKEVKNDGIVI
jgi:hypothetical protein